MLPMCFPWHTANKTLNSLPLPSYNANTLSGSRIKNKDVQVETKVLNKKNITIHYFTGTPSSYTNNNVSRTYVKTTDGAPRSTDTNQRGWLVDIPSL